MPPAAPFSAPPPHLDRSYYAILALPAPTRNGTSSEVITSYLVKKAYHKALLRWHPDKALSSHVSRQQREESSTGSSDGSTEDSSPKYTLDEIITAYTTLSTERGRREYEREYRLQLTGPTAAAAAAMMREQVSGIWNAYAPMDVVDLDDFDYVEVSGKFYRGCRCGNEEGYVLWERDLEDVQTGEVQVGCGGCSLWLRVQFEVVPEWEEEAGTGQEVAMEDGAEPRSGVKEVQGVRDIIGETQ